MADRTIKPDDTNDLVLQNNDGSSKLELNEDQTVKVTTGSDSGEDFTVNSTQLVVEGDSGNVGIGTANPTSSSGNTLEIFDNSSPTLKLNDGGDYKAYLKLVGNDLEIRGSNGQLEFYTGNADGESSTERMKIASSSDGDVTVSTGSLIIGTSGQGIGFGSTLSQHTLNDYETGVFTATTQSGSLHSNNDQCSYTKIGELVTVRGQVRINGDGGESAFIINNLPFTAKAATENDNFSVGAVRTFSYDLESNILWVVAIVDAADNTIQFQGSRDGLGATAIPMKANAYIMFTVSYRSD